MKGALGRLILIATVLIAAIAIWGRGEPAFAGPTDPAGGTAITNTASATWQDSRGSAYHIASNEIVATVQAISALVVTPKEPGVNASLDGFPAGQNVTKTFVITNASNIADAYRITALTADKGRILSAAFVTPSGLQPIALSSTTSPPVQPGASVSVRVVLDTNGIQPGMSLALHLTAQTTAAAANGVQNDTGEQWLIAASQSMFAGPSAPDTPVQKTVDRQLSIQVEPSGTVAYAIAVKNYGGSPATHAVLTDTIPDGLSADASSATLDGSPITATLSGQTLTVPIGTIAAGETVQIGFSARVKDITTIGSSYVNVATLNADGMSPVSTSPAAVFVGTADVVYDPENGNKAVAGATLSLLDAGENLVKLSAAPTAQTRAGAADRRMDAGTQNPFVTGSDGTYGFALSPSQIAAGGSTYYLTVNAPGYLNRRIELHITRQNDDLYTVDYASKDGQPVARAGAYTLTNSSVQLANVFGLFGNVPLFKAQTLSIGKIVNRTSAEPGDRLVYTVDAANLSPKPLGPVTIVDTLPAGEAYATGSARMNGASSEPAVNGRTLTWTVQSLEGGGKREIVYAAVLFPSVAGGTLLTNSVRADAIIAGTIVDVNASANADVMVVDGALSDRSVLMGRVFLDTARTGRYQRPDRGVSGVRVYMEDGSSAVTDAEGRFTFPSVRPGMHVLRVDASTLLPGLHGVSLQRLVHGLLDDGLMQDVEFPIEGTP